jgi:hypothetical protein
MLFLLIETKLDAYVVPVRSGRLYSLQRENNAVNVYATSKSSLRVKKGYFRSTDMF